MATAMEAEISSSLKALEDVWYTKVYDMPRIDGSRFGVSRPFDFIALCSGTFLGIEAKQSRNPTSLPLANIHEHQVEAVNEVERCGGFGCFLVNVRLTKSSPRSNRMFMLTAEQVDYWFNVQDERKSIPVPWMEENCVEVNRVKLPNSDKYGWDLTNLSPLRDCEYDRGDELRLL